MPLLLFIAIAAMCFVASPAVLAEEPAKTVPMTFTGPFTHENLTVFLIHGQSAADGKNYLTLQEALEQKKVVVHETGNVNELTIENVSETDEVFVHSGDIVKGGKQDRVLAVDLVVPVKSGQVPIASFCVEQGRWTNRGGEAVNAFAASNDQLTGKNARYAAKGAAFPSAEGRSDVPQIQVQTGVDFQIVVGEPERELRTLNTNIQPLAQQGQAQVRETRAVATPVGQSAVWEEVAQNQAKISGNIRVNVQSAESATSYQLTLENKKLQESTEAYQKALAGVVDGKEDVIGFAFAINGKINSADTYVTHALFKKLWPKLLKASAVEAIAELQAGKTFEPAKLDALKTAITEAEKGKAVEKSVTQRVKLVSKKQDKNTLFETYDGADAKKALHRSFIVTD